MDRFLCYALVFLGGGTGALLRYVTDLGGAHPFQPGNLLACFLIGITYAIFRYRIFTSKYVQAFLTLGFLGGLSTFTPLAIFAVACEQSSVIFSSLYLACFVLVFFVVAVIGYSLAALFFIRVMHRQPMPSLAAAFRSYRHNKARKKQQEAKDIAKSKRLREIISTQNNLKEQLQAERQAKANLMAKVEKASAVLAEEVEKEEEIQQEVEIFNTPQHSKEQQSVYAEARAIALKTAEDSYKKAYKKALQEKLAQLKQEHRNTVLGFKDDSEDGSQLKKH